MVPLSFSGRNFRVTRTGGLFWPERQALLVADLHLEKASWFARFGQMLPPYDSHATLELLQGDIAATGAKSVAKLVAERIGLLEKRIEEEVRDEL